MLFLYKTFPGTSDKIFYCAKFHSSIVLFPDCQNMTSVKQQNVALPLNKDNLHIDNW